MVIGLPPLVVSAVLSDGLPLPSMLLTNTEAAEVLPRKPKACGGAALRTLRAGALVIHTEPSLNFICCAVLTANPAGTSICAPAPKTTPAGLTKKKSGCAPPAARKLKGPWMYDASPPVTRVMTLRIELVLVVNVADSPGSMLKREKL